MPSRQPIPILRLASMCRSIAQRLYRRRRICRLIRGAMRLERARFVLASVLAALRPERARHVLASVFAAMRPGRPHYVLASVLAAGLVALAATVAWHHPQARSSSAEKLPPTGSDAATAATLESRSNATRFAASVPAPQPKNASAGPVLVQSPQSSSAPQGTGSEGMPRPNDASLGAMAQLAPQSRSDTPDGIDQGEPDKTTLPISNTSPRSRASFSAHHRSNARVASAASTAVRKPHNIERRIRHIARISRSFYARAGGNPPAQQAFTASQPPAISAPYPQAR
jgi:hypothetical protein